MPIKTVTLFVACIAVFFSADIKAVQKDEQSMSSQPGRPQLLYMKSVQEYVHKRWSYKKTLDNQFYSVQLDLLLDSRGHILEKKIIKLSPDQAYNDYALKALVEMEPYPPFPDTLDVKKIEVRFHLMPNR